ncbi:MAG: imelysin family protein [Pseudomonadota bacterium]
MSWQNPGLFYLLHFSVVLMHNTTFRSGLSSMRFGAVIASLIILAGCGGGGGGGSTPVAGPPTPPPSNPPPVSGDDARRAVLADIGNEIILPALQAFDTNATGLQTATAAHAAAPTDAATKTAAQTAWNTAMDAWQRNEVLQVGPAGRSTNPDAVAGGQDFRDFIYSWPFTLDFCALEQAALDGDAVTSATPINITGLGALEYLLYTDMADASCAAQPDAAARAAHAERLADRIALLATSLLGRWDPAGGNFLEQWSTAGESTSVVYPAPQDALDALSVALFYGEKITKDRKVAQPAGLPATGLVCSQPISCPEFLESPLSERSGRNLIINFETFRDVFTGLNGGMGMNELLTGIDRDDLATEIITGLDAALVQLEAIEMTGGFDAAVAAIANRDECVNAFSASSGVPPCALLGFMKTAMDTFRGPIVASLNLAVPQTAAGDND